MNKHAINLAVSHPKKSLLFALGILFILAYGLKFFKSNFSARIWHKPDSPEILSLNNFERQFGGDEIFILGIDYEKSVYNEQTLKKISDLTEKIWMLPNVLRVDSLANSNHISFDKDDIRITSLVPEPITDIKSIESNADDMEEIQNVLINKNKNLALFTVTLVPSFGENPNYTPFTKKLYELLDKEYPDRNKVLFLGQVAVANAFKEVSESDNKKHLPTMFILIMIALFIYFRSFTGVIIPIVIVTVTVVESFGFLAYMGFEFNSILGSIPGVLLGICLADAIHVLTVFYQEKDKGLSKKEAIKESLRKNLTPTILTTITTAISFLSISFSELVPVHDLGMTAFFGTCMAWFNTYLLIPSLIVLFASEKTKGKNKSFLRFDFSNFIIKHKKVITFGYLALTSIAFVFCFYNEANSDPLKYFTPQTKIRRDFVKSEKELEAIRTHNIVVDAGEADGAKDPNLLKNVDQFIEEVEALPFVSKVRSLLDVLKKMNQNLNDNDESFYKVPDSKSQVAEYLLLYTLGSSQDLGLDNLISRDNQHLNIILSWQVDTTKDSIRKNEIVQNIAKKYGLKTNAGGTFSVYAGVNQKIVDSFFKSIFMAVILVSFVIFIVFRSYFYAVLAMLPNFIPLIFVGAYTAINKIYVDVGSSIVFTICLGIAVDDTIHFMSHFIRHKQQGLSLKESLGKTFTSSGEAIFLTTLVLIVGFGSFAFADFLPNKKFGILASMVLFFALITDLIFLPAILSLFSREKEVR